MKKAEKIKYPSKIYLQIESYEGGIVAPDELLDCEITWCQDRISKSDLVYYKKDYLKQSASADKILESIYTPMKENEDWGEWGKRVAEAISKSIIGK